MKGIIGVEIDVRFDPTVVQPQADPLDLVGTASRGLFAVTNGNEPGLLKVVMYGPSPIDANSVLLNLKFTAVGAPGTVSPITFEHLSFNEGDTTVTTTDGRIEVSKS